MERDKLKDYVSTNRVEFDLYEFEDPMVWQGINDALDKKTETVQIPVKYLWRVAAAVVFLAGISGYLFLQNQYLQQDALAFGQVSADLAEAHEYYGTLISTKIEQIETSSHNMGPSIYQDMEALDKAFGELKEDLKDNADNEEVINAMIYNYKLKLEILEKILDEIDLPSTNKEKNKFYN